MKKLTKIIALALALALMLGLTASAATLYYAQDFSAYNTTTEMFNDVASMTQTVVAHSAVTPIASLTPGKMNSANGAGQFELRTNANGQKYPAFTVYATVGFYHVPTNAWTATANESYVISFNLETAAEDTLGAYNFLGLVGKDANGAYAVAPIGYYHEKGDLRSQYTGGTSATLTGAVGSGHGTVAIGSTKRYAIKFDLNADGGLVRSGYSTDSEGVYSCWYAGSTYGMDSFVSVAGFGAALHQREPDLGDIKMYTISGDLTATSTMNGATNVDVATEKVTLAFNQPIGGADVVVTANGETVEGVTTAVRDVVGNGTITSEVDVIFAEDLDYGKTYSIDVSNVTNEIAEKAVSDPITFSTLALPTFSTNYTAYEGLSASGTTIDAANAAGKTVYVAASATNTTEGRAVTGAIVIGIYDAANNLVKYASSAKSFAVGGTNTFAAAFKLEAGQSIRVTVE